jgi:large subunit ribosomal protein L3
VIQGLLGRKIGMVQIFDAKGRLRGGTVIETGPCVVTQLKNEQRDGYVAVQIGYGTAKRLNKPARGHAKRLGDFRFLREFRVSEPETVKIGDRVGTEMFQEGDRVDITAKSKGRGFAGSVKRHHFAGGPKTHGQSDRTRAPGAIGAGNTPGRTFKGLRMAGHMGAEQVTVRNVEVLQTNTARGLIIVAGSVPGARDGLVKLRLSKATLAAVRSGKRQVAAPVEEEEAPTPADDVQEEGVDAAAPVDEVTPESDADVTADEPTATTEEAGDTSEEAAADAPAEEPAPDEEKAAE